MNLGLSKKIKLKINLFLYEIFIHELDMDLDFF